MIDKVYILNIESETHRRAICERELQKAGVPQDKIARWHAKTCTPYKTTRELCEDASYNGYITFTQLIQTNIYRNCYITYLAQTWSYLSFFKHLQETGETAILIHDDTKFNCSFDELLTACETPKNLLVGYLSTTITKQLNRRQFTNTKSCWLKHIDPDTIRDWSVIYTPQGAALLLDYFENIPDLTDGWILSPIKRSKIFQFIPGFCELLINPTTPNLKNIKDIHKILTTDAVHSINPHSYSAASGIKELPESTIHDNRTGAPLRSLENTKE